MCKLKQELVEIVLNPINYNKFKKLRILMKKNEILFIIKYVINN